MNEFLNNSCKTLCKVNKSTRLRCTVIERINRCKPLHFQEQQTSCACTGQVADSSFFYLFEEKNHVFDLHFRKKWSPVENIWNISPWWLNRMTSCCYRQCFSSKWFFMVWWEVRGHTLTCPSVLTVQQRKPHLWMTAHQ